MEAEEEEGMEAEEEEVEEAEEEEVEETEEEPELSIEMDIDAPPQPPAPRPKPSPKGAGAFPPLKPAPKHAPALDAPPKPPAKGAVRRKPQPAYKYGGKKELVESASHGTLREVPGVYYIPVRWVDRRHPLTLRRLGAPRGAPGVGHLYALFFEAHPDGTMRKRVCETGGAGYAEVEYICTHLGTLFEGVPGCTKMPSVHFWVSPPKRETTFSVRRNGNRGVARCTLLLARIMAHWIKGGYYVPLEDLPGVGAGVEFTTVAEMWGDVAMLAAWGGDMARRPGQRPSGKLGAVCDEVTAMVEAWTMSLPSCHCLGWGTLHWRLRVRSHCACRLGVLCPTLGGGVLEKSKSLCPRGGGRRLRRRPSAPAGCNKGCGWPNGCRGARGVRGLHTSNQRHAWVRRGS